MNLNVYRLHKLHDNNILLCITKKNQIMRSNYETWNVKHNTPDDIIRNRFSKLLSRNWFCFCAFLAMYLYESMLNFEIYQILWCQNVYGFVVPSIIFQLINIFFRLQPVEQILSFFSVFTKMATVFSYVFPLLYLHSPEFYIRTLLTSIGSNILTILLKWLVPHIYKRFVIKKINKFDFILKGYFLKEDRIGMCFRCLSQTDHIFVKRNWLVKHQVAILQVIFFKYFIITFTMQRSWGKSFIFNCIEVDKLILL